MTEDKMVGWHHRLKGLSLSKLQELVDGQGGLVCCSLWLSVPLWIQLVALDPPLSFAPQVLYGL